MILDLLYNFLAQAEGTRVVGSGGLQLIRIAEMLGFTLFPLIFS